MNLSKFTYQDKRGARGRALSELNRSALAKCAGISRSQLSRIVNGHVEPPVKTLRRIAVCLGTTIDEVDVWLRGLKAND